MPLLLVLAALLALPTAASVGCNSTRPCRQGTVFLSLRLGPYAGADHMTVGVSVDGGPAKESTVMLTAATAGGLEIGFPSGYPAGKRVMVAVALTKNMLTVASKTAVATLSPGCSTLEIDFGDADAGSDVHVSTGGRAGGGAGGLNTDAGGAAGGTAGASGLGGAGGGISNGGNGPGGGGGGGGDSPRGGRGGGAGASGGAPATGGRGGNAGGGGLAAPGTGGTGTSGAGGTTDGGTDRGCFPAATAENCYNGVDDDCNGLIDCADPACTPVAQCEPLDPTTGTVGASVQASAACPAGATTTRTLNAGLAAAPCSGCSCGAGTATVVCSADVYGYPATTANTCSSNIGGTLTTTLDTTQGCVTPNWPGTTYGVRASAFRATPQGTCLPSGVVAKGAPVWGSTTKFCGVPAVGAGCAAGAVCVPRAVVTAGICMLIDGSRACPAAAPHQTAWFTGFTDARTCGMCSCGTPTGGNCGSMLIAVGSDYVCLDASAAPLNGYVRDGDRFCSNAGIYSPGIQFTGTPIAPTCAPSVATSGTLTATGPQTLCCI